MIIADFIWAVTTILTIAIIIRAILSWFPNINPANPAVEFIITITEPVLAPIRSVMPRGMIIDLTPMIAIFLLQIIGQVLIRATSS